MVALLIQGGHDVVGVDNLNEYYDVSLKRHRLDALTAQGLRFAHTDIEDHSEMSRIFAEQEFDGIINLAARAGVRYSMENPHVYLSTNTVGTLNLLELAKEYDVPKFVLASTSSLYAGQPIPFVETLPVNTPISPYAATKKAAEMLAYTYHHLYGLDVSVCRYFTVYGPGGRPDMCIFRFIRWIDEGTPLQLFGDGEQSRDFTYVDDIARGTISALKPLGFETINLGGGESPTTLNEVIAKIEELLGKKAEIKRLPFHKADIVTTRADISKAKKLLGWAPETTLNHGLDTCVRWHVENRPWSNEIILP